MLVQLMSAQDGQDDDPASRQKVMNRLDFKDGKFTLNGQPVIVVPLSYNLRVGCHVVSYRAVRRLWDLAKRCGPIEALDE